MPIAINWWHPSHLQTAQEGSLLQLDGSVSQSHPFRLTGVVRHQMLGLKEADSWDEDTI